MDVKGQNGNESIGKKLISKGLTREIALENIVYEGLTGKGASEKQ